MQIKTVNKVARLVCLATFLFHNAAVWAGVQVVGTRLIFQGDKKEASLPVENSGTRPFLVQAWVDNGKDMGAPTAENKAPFFMTPPLSRLDGGKQNILRVLRVGGSDLPTDRESVFWLNVKEIPEASKEQNVLQLAMRTRLKLFYRPAGLESDPHDAHAKLSWALVSKAEQGKSAAPALLVKNPTPYYITVSNLKINGDKEVEVTEMVPPLGEISYSLEKLKLSAVEIRSLSYQTINDYGAETEALQVKLTPEKVALVHTR